MKQSSSSPAVCGTVHGGMTTQDAVTTVEIRDTAYETTPIFGWGWPDEARLTDFAEMADRMEQAAGPLEVSPEYATLYFGS
jgi:hypothetical protein